MQSQNSNQFSKRESLREHLTAASKTVAGWPDWKKNLLQQTNVGTSSTPRTSSKDDSKQAK